MLECTLPLSTLALPTVPQLSLTDTSMTLHILPHPHPPRTIPTGVQPPIIGPSLACRPDHSLTHNQPPSSSRRVLAYVLARKEREANKMQQLLTLTFAKLDEESQRATDAERRATECLVRARSAIDARAHADADATAARSELAMYKVQLEQAQREISRAQEMLDGLEARRHDAEEDAARARSVARKLQEARAIETAREEGKQQGWHEGLRHGRALGRREAENQLRSRRREEAEDGYRSRSRPRGLGDPVFTQVTPVTPQRGTSERSSPDDLHPRGVPECVNPTTLIFFISFITSFQVDALPRLGRSHPSPAAQNCPTSPVAQPDDTIIAHLTRNHMTSMSHHLLPHDHDHDLVWSPSRLSRLVRARTRPITIHRLRSSSPSPFLPLCLP